MRPPTIRLLTTDGIRDEAQAQSWSSTSDYTLRNKPTSFSFFFAQTRYKDTSEVSKGNANAPSAISTHNFVGRSPTRRARMFTMYTKSRRVISPIRAYIRTRRLLSRHFRSFTTECNFVPTWHMAYSDITSCATDYHFVCAFRYFETQ